MKRFRIFAAAVAALALAVGFSVPYGRAQAEYDMPYYIVVDISSQIVTVYDAGTNDIARQMLCSTGKKDYTPTGTFVLPKNSQRYDRQPWYYIAMFRRYVRYATRIKGQFLFHSIPYTRKSLQSIDAQAASELGTPASHGCIRLRWQDAEFIAENCLPGTVVKIIKSGNRDDGLRELLYQRSFDAGEGLSYESFLGISTQEGALGRFSEGQEVLNLQYRLRDLGLYGGELSGTYDSTTVNAVRTAQYLLGEDMSGIATQEFQQTLFGPDAPTAMNVRLSEGMSGPAVRRLQDNLAALRLYTDEPDNVYDAAVVEAVRQFQRAYGYEQDGVAAPKIQKAVAHEAARIAAAFGDEGYACRWVDEPLTLVRVNVKAGIKLRQAASQESKPLRRLSMGKAVMVLEKGGDWSRVRSGDDVGYVKNSLVEFSERQVSMLEYTSDASGLVCTIGSSADDYRAGAKLPCEVFDESLAASEESLDLDSLASYVTVRTGEDGALLNLRASPSADGDVLDTVPDGTSLRVQRRYADWTQVSYQGQAGYLMNRYLRFWTGPKDALDIVQDDEDAPTTGFAVVQSAAGGPAAVYSEDSDDAAVLGHLRDGARLEVLESADGWCRIRYEGHEGYMIAEDLQLEDAGDASSD